MLRSIGSTIHKLKADPNISVITNFGCHSNCWYCIWKGHELENIQAETDWAKMEQFLHKYKHKHKVSISGGGDSLYEYEKHAEWWKRLFNLASRYNLLVDIHTRERFYGTDFWHKVNRVVVSSDVLRDDEDYFRWLLNYTKLRITHVVTKATTLDIIADYLKFQNETGCQFTIKELVGFDDGGMYKKVRETYPDIFYLDAGDYNVYYMPDNSVRKSFL